MGSRFDDTHVFHLLTFMESFSPLLFQAKQRASIKWLLSKAYDHKTPEELVEPFYKDHDVREPNNTHSTKL